MSSHPVEHAIEKTRDHGENRWLQRFQIIHQKANVPLEETNSAPVDEDDTLRREESAVNPACK